MSPRKVKKRNTTPKAHDQKPIQRNLTRVWKFWSFRHFDISPSVGVLIAVGIFLAGSALLLALLSSLKHEAEVQKIQTKVVQPLVCDGWKNSDAARQVDVIESGKSDAFSIQNSAYIKTGMRDGHTESLDDVSVEEPQRIVCSGFSLDDLSDYDIRSGTLDVSLGAQVFDDAEDVLSIAYSLDGESWQTLESQIVSQSFGNYDDDGYKHFSLATIAAEDKLEDLQVRFSFYPKSSIGQTNIYLDGVQLLLNAQRKLAVPDVPTGVVEMAKFEFSPFEQPTFAVQVDDGGIPFFSKHVIRSVKSIELIDPSNQMTNNLVELADSKDKNLEQYDINPSAFSKPGKYTLRITLEENGEEKKFIQEFAWGVLALNFDKSNYVVDETGNISIGVLDDEGDIVCDADIELQIVDPLGAVTKFSTDEGSIIVTEFCKKKEEFKEPDYHTTYTFESNGAYKIILSATHANGTFSIEDTVTVAAQQEFSVQRYGPTRVFPKVWQPMELRVTAYESYTGELHELLPDGFEIEASDLYTISEVPRGNNVLQQISWNVNLSEGQNATFRYRFKPPDVSPAFYVLGPLTLGAWQESRVWQLAVDPTYMYLLANTDTGVASGWVLDSGSDGNFLHAAATAGGTGGNAIHTHTFTTTVGLASTTVGASCSFSCKSAASAAHTHISLTSIDAANNDPANYSFYLWKYNTADVAPSGIPDNTFILFDNGTGQPTSPWTRFSAADNRLIKIDSSHTTGGSDTHTHNINWGSLLSASGSVNYSAILLDNFEVYNSTTHTHTAPSTPTTTASATSVPEYSTFEIYEQTDASDQTLPTGMIALFDGAPPAGWTVISDGAPSQDQFVRGSATAGSTGGDATNTHSNVVGTTGIGTPTVLFSSFPGGTNAARANHTHDITLSSFSSDSHDPVYEDYILAEYDGPVAADISGSVLGTDESSFIGNPPCDGSTEVVSLRVNGGTENTTSCNATTGAYSFTGITVAGGDTVTIYLNGAGATSEVANTILVSNGATITGVNLYENRVVVRDDGDGTLSILDMLDYDNDQNAAQMLFDADDLATDTLGVESTYELHVWTGDTFDPNGTITTTSGNLHLDDSATLNFDTASNTIGGGILIDTSATLNAQQTTAVQGIAVQVSGTLNLTSGTFTIGVGSTEDMIVNGGTLNVSGGTLTIQDDLITTAGGSAEDINITGGTVNINSVMDLNDTSSTIDIGGGGGSADVNITTQLDMDGGTLTIDANADVDITSSTGDFLVDGAGSTVKLTDGSLDAGRYFRWNGGATVELRGGSHHTGTYGSGTNGTWEMQASGSLTFNMISGNNSDANGCNITASNINVYNGGTLTTGTPTGGTICMGTTHTTRLFYDAESETHQFYNLKILENAGIHTLSSQPIPLKGSMTINSGKTFTGNNEAMVIEGGWINNGTFIASTSTITLLAGDMSGTSDTTFYNLNIGDGTTSNTVTVNNTDDPSVSNNLDIDSGDILSIGSDRVVSQLNGTGAFTFDGTLTGAGRFDYKDASVFPSGGTQGSSLTIRFDTTSVNLWFPARTFDGPVEIYGNEAGTKTVTSSGNITFNGTVELIQDSTGPVVLDLDTWNQTDAFNDDVTIGSNTIFEASSDSITLDTLTFTDNGTFSHNDGTVVFAGASSFITGTSDTVFYDLIISGSIPTVEIRASGSNDPIVMNSFLISVTFGGITIDAGRTITIDDGATLSFAGAVIDGNGTLVYQPAAAFPSSGALYATLRFDSTQVALQTMSARAYNGNVEIYGNNTSNTVRGEAGSYTINGTLDLIQDGTGTTIFDFDTNDPTLTVNGKLTIDATSNFKASSASTLILKGDAESNGDFDANGGTVSLDGTSLQTISGDWASSDGFYDFIITNASGSDPDTDPSVYFNASDITVFHIFYVNTAGVKMRFATTIDFEMGGLNFSGSSGAGNQVYLRSDTPDSRYRFTYVNFYGQVLTYVDARDADSQYGTTINATGTGNVNSGNNLNWNFGYITLTGTVYSDTGSSAYNCSGNNLTINVSVNGDATPDSGTCTAADGTYTIALTQPSGTDDLIVAYIDGAESVSATTATLSLDILEDVSMDLYIDYVLIDSETGTTMTNTLLDTFDAGDDADIDYTVTSNNIVISSGHGLYGSVNYTPGGTLTTPASGANAGVTTSGGDGDLIIKTGTSLYAGSYAFSIGGDLLNNGTHGRAFGQTTTFTGTTTGFTIDIGTANLGNLIFNGSGGGWSFTTNITTEYYGTTLTMTNGTLSGTVDLTIGSQAFGSNVVCGVTCGTINMTGGAVILKGAGNLTNNTDWTFYNLTFDHTTMNTYTTTASGTGKITVTHILTTDDTMFVGPVYYYHQLDGGSKIWELTGAVSVPFDNRGGFIGSSSTFRYKNTGAVTPAVTDNASTNYYNILELIPTSSSSYSLTSDYYYVDTDLTINSNTNLNPNNSTFHFEDPTGNIDAGGQILYNVEMWGMGAMNRTFINTDATISGAITVTSNFSSYTISSGVVLTVSGSELSGSGSTINGAGLLRFVPGSGGPGTGPNIETIVRYDATDGDIAASTVDARFYQNKVEFYSNILNTNRTIDMGAGTFNLSGASSHFYVINDDDDAEPLDGGILTVDASDNNPTVNIGGDIDFPAVLKDGGENVITGTGTWTVSGDLETEIDWQGFVLNAFTVTSGNRFIMDGTLKTLTTFSNPLAQHFYNFTFSGVTSVVGRLYINNDILISGTLTPGSTISIGNGWTDNGAFIHNNQSVSFIGTSGTINGTSDTDFYNLSITPSGDGTVTLQTSEPIINHTLTVATGDTFDLGSGLEVLIETAATLALNGTISGDGRIDYMSSTNFPSTGTMDADLRFNLIGPTFNMTAPARAYGGEVRAECFDRGMVAGGFDARSVTFAAGTLSIGGDLAVRQYLCDGYVTLNLDTNDPTTSIAGATTISWGGILSASSSSTLSFGGDYTQDGGGIFTDNSGTVVLNGTSQQTMSGDMTASNADFYNMTITNASGSDPDIIFANDATVNNNFTAITAGSQIQFVAGGTFTFYNIDFNGQGSGTRVDLTSSAMDTQWNIDVAGSRSVSYTQVRDSYACGTPPDIDASNGTNKDLTNNDCWNINTMTFSISDTSVGFGTLGFGGSRYATGDTTGSGSEVEAHTISATTSAPDGYVIIVVGPTLTYSGATIDAIGGVNTAPNPGTEQFGLRMTATGGSGTVSAPYDDAGFAYAADGSTTDEVASSTGSSDTTTYSVRYLGNISGATESGFYATDLTYIITPTF